MKLCISIIHLGRYKIEILNDDNQVSQGYDCGSAGIILAISEWIFHDEAAQYERDQKASSAQLGQSVIEDMLRAEIASLREQLAAKATAP